MMFSALVVVLATCLGWLPLTIAENEGRSLDADVLYRAGDVALDDWPSCDFFVVHTQHGFSLMEWQRGSGIFGEGDDIYGLTDHTGLQTVLVASLILSGQISIRVEAVGLDLPHAQAAFYKRCKVH